jgi:nucleoside-diphosphate-sugar epimerase
MGISKHAIIGYSGFVGSNLLKQYKKKYKRIDLFNSKNIFKISNNNSYKSVFCAALPAAKWIANKYPNKDKLNTLKLIKNLKNIRTELFVLISTIDVHFNHVYGKNRKMLEYFVKNNFQNYLIIRLPGIFGTGLKKNVIYDLINKNELQKIYSNDYFQWYDLDLLKKNIESLKINKNKIYEFYSAPIENKKIINLFKKIDSKKVRLNPIRYKFRPKNGYMFSEKYMLLRIKKFIKKYEY